MNYSAQLDNQVFGMQSLGLSRNTTSEPLSPDVAGLSHSSFANLRRRAFDSGKEEMQPNDGQKNFMGALPMPKFLKESNQDVRAMSLIGTALEESSEEDDDHKISF